MDQTVSLKIIKELNDAKVNMSELINKFAYFEKRMIAIEENVVDGKIYDSKFGDERYGIQTRQLSQRLSQKSQASAYIKNAPLIDQFAYSITGLIGLKETITTKHPILKFIWAFVFLLGIGATVFFIYATTNEYLEDPTLTRMKLDTKPFYDFPPIVLCNEGWFDVDKAASLGLSVEGLKYSLGYFTYSYSQLKLDNGTRAREEFYQIYHQHNFTSLIDYYKTIAFNLKPEYNANIFYNSTTPSYYATQDGLRVERVFLPEVSVCHSFLFQPAEARMGSMIAPERIRIKFQDKTRGLVSVSPHWLMYLSSDANSLYTWPQLIEVSMNNIVKIKAQKFVSLTKSSAPCVLSEEAHENYTTANCMADCANQMYKDQFRCKLLWLSTEDDPELNPEDCCNYFDPQKDNVTVYENKMDTMEADIKQFCNNSRCPQKCDKVLYEAVLEEKNAVWKAFQSYKIAATTMPNSNATVTTINIIHDAMQQGGILTITEVNSYSFTSLVNNVGGTLGLFVGGTLMTLVQLIMFFVNCIFEKQK